MTTTENETVDPDVKITKEDADAEGFISIWRIAAVSCGDDTPMVRALAARLLCFLCKKKADFVITSTANAEYLDNWFERDNKLLYDWKPESESVDVVAQHAEVSVTAFLLFLKTAKFKPTQKYNPTRAERVAWFQEMWNVG